MSAEKRIDPEDGAAYTFDEISTFYKGKYKKAAIKEYWESMKPAKQGKAEAKAKGKAEAKAKGKAKAKAKATADAGCKEGPAGPADPKYPTTSQAEYSHMARSEASSGSLWARYPSIEGVANAAYIQELRAMAAADGSEWVATEKVHGSNFCFETDGECVEYASRSQKLGGTADFFNARDTMPRYHTFVRAAFELAKRHFPELRRLLIYGEYFGGWYPGMASSGLKKVQGGIAYSPDHHFYAFDVSPGGGVFLDFDDARELLLAAGFPLVATPLRRGCLEELLAIDLETLETGIPDLLGHPPLPQHRIAEGIVVRRARNPLGDRPVLKLKARAFWEATNQHAQGARQANATANILGQSASQNRNPDNSPVGALLFQAQDLVTLNRLRAVISKSPDLLEAGKENRLAGLFAQDVLEELALVHAEALAALGKDRGALQKAVMQATRAFEHQHLAAIRADVG